MRLLIREIVLVLVCSCLLPNPLFASDPVTVVIEETTIEQKTNLFVYGYAEGVDRRQEVSITVTDRKAKTLELLAETNKIGNWGIEAVDISTLSDGKIIITAAITDEAGKTVAQTTSTAVLDTSFSLFAFMNKHFAATIFLLMVTLLLLGFPMKIPLIAGATLGVILLYDGDLSQMQFMIQQMMAGIRPAALIAVPMFILSADIMTRGKSAEKLIDLVMAFVRHIKGGLAVSTSGACAVFGAVSGSTQATVVAIGSPLRPRASKRGIQRLLYFSTYRQLQRYRFLDSAQHRDDYLWHCRENFHTRTVYRRYRPGTVDPGSVFHLQCYLCVYKQDSHRTESLMEGAGTGIVPRAMAVGISRPSLSEASSAASLAPPKLPP